VGNAAGYGGRRTRFNGNVGTVPVRKVRALAVGRRLKHCAHDGV